ncbi:hypothetical protein DSCA_55070 [Desulfosarcina alkanivorans]|jgi:uncharacterized membrane protein|uniref:Membrane iron-sulfur containing protein FtrD-like domain-containing protein n=1 Tax=Desulfosarcina alkanivorans TaxID=571177 RepID=A0A5K7Z4M1_9BACT|nr:DUF2318 domain-containing protein [Desulfosarcina alkanivorans]BBO71577.1 hypothetical protein DSCA_55070 [Desulfosarcina alkanivorans]
MTAKRKSSTHSTRETKKAIVMNAGKKNPTPIVIAAVVVIAAAAGLGLFLFPGANTPGTPAAGNTPTADDGRITYAASMFADGKARHFQYADGNITISYFILKSTDGVIRAAFDACDVCWQAGKGYYQEGGDMVCRNCGRHFESVKVNEVQGGCNPAPLARTIENDRVVIRVADLKKGRSYFNFSPKA